MQHLFSGHALAKSPVTFREMRTQAVEREIEHSVADHAGSGEQALSFRDRDDIRQAHALRRLDQTGRNPGLAQDMRVVELQPIQIEFDRAPRMRGHQVAEIVGELLDGQPVNLMIKVIADPADRPRIGFDRLRLQPFELEVLQMTLVLPVKVR